MFVSLLHHWQRRNLSPGQREVTGRLNNITQTWEYWYSTFTVEHRSTNNLNAVFVHFERKINVYEQILNSGGKQLLHHLAKDFLLVGLIIFFCFQTLLLNSDRKGPFQPTFSMKITTSFQRTDSMECVWANIKSGFEDKKTNKKTVVQKLKWKTKHCVSITQQAFVNKYRDIKMDISYRSPYNSSIRLGLRSSITIIYVKIKSIITFIT